MQLPLTALHVPLEVPTSVHTDEMLPTVPEPQTPLHTYPAEAPTQKVGQVPLAVAGGERKHVGTAGVRGGMSGSRRQAARQVCA